VQDELFYLHEGAIEFTADGETRTVSAGQSTFVPGGTKLR
jgi:quercetin dioxygenase-like cupin family protein